MPRPPTPMDPQYNSRWNTASDLQLLYTILSLTPRISLDFQTVSRRLGRTPNACQQRYHHLRRKAKAGVLHGSTACKSKSPANGEKADKHRQKGFGDDGDAEDGMFGMGGKEVQYDDPLVEVKTERDIKREDDGEVGVPSMKSRMELGAEREQWDDEVVFVGERRWKEEEDVEDPEDPFGFANTLG